MGRGVIPVDWDEVAALALGALEARRRTRDSIRPRITADSRTAGPGDLFVALNTGVEYVGGGRARGARRRSSRTTRRPRLRRSRRSSARKSAARVVAVVGSTGKTSTKDILGALCSAVTPTVWAEASQNNEIGLPLTVCRLEPETRGARDRDGDARARPDRRAVRDRAARRGARHARSAPSTSSSSARSSASPRRTPRRSRRCRPAGSPSCRPTRRSSSRTSSAPTSRSAASTAPRSSGARPTTWRFPLGGADERRRSSCRSRPRHMAENTLAALVAYDALGLPLDRAQEGANAIRLSRWRGEELPLPGRRPRRQRRLQREPDLDARGARSTSSSVPAGGDASRSSARWPSSGEASAATTRRSAQLSTSSGSRS